MGRSLVETLIGAGVLALAVVFPSYAYTTSNVATVAGYEVAARIFSVDGLNAGDDVRISGIKVGSVIGMTLDPLFYRAIMRFSIDPGGADELIANGGEIKITQPPINLESLPGKLIHGFSSSED